MNNIDWYFFFFFKTPSEQQLFPLVPDILPITFTPCLSTLKSYYHLWEMHPKLMESGQVKGWNQNSLERVRVFLLAGVCLSSGS